MLPRATQAHLGGSHGALSMRAIAAMSRSSRFYPVYWRGAEWLRADARRRSRASPGQAPMRSAELHRRHVDDLAQSRAGVTTASHDVGRIRVEARFCCNALRSRMAHRDIFAIVPMSASCRFCRKSFQLRRMMFVDSVAAEGRTEDHDGTSSSRTGCIVL
jgi:hypothetical protein